MTVSGRRARSTAAEPEGGLRFEAEVREFYPAVGVLVLAVLLVLPFALVNLLGGSFELNFFTGVLIYCILGLSLDLIWGYGGIISLAQGTFFGVGAYAMAYALLHTGGVRGIVIGVAVGVPLAAVVGLIFGLISFRARVGGLYFAILTLALALVASLAATTLDTITGGDNGLYGLPGLSTLWSHGDIIQYYVVLGIALATLLFCWVFVNSHFGRVLTAARENELRAASIGFDVPTAKALTFGVAAAVASLAGVLYAPYNGIVNPGLVGFATGANVLIWVAIGGRGYLLGAIVGTVLLNYAQFHLTDVVAIFVGSKAISVWPVAFGVVFLFVILVFPDGIVGSFARLGPRKVRVKRRPPIPWVQWTPSTPMFTPGASGVPSQRP